MPVDVRVEPLDDTEEIVPNIVVISDENVDSMEAELGSNYSEYRWQYYVDVYAESQVCGRELAGDLRAILEGKLPSIGRNMSNLAVYDLSQATPSVIFNCDIEKITVDRGRFYDRSYEKFWWMISFELTDFYGDEDDEDGYLQ
jgi:hypothetical protein